MNPRLERKKEKERRKERERERERERGRVRERKRESAWKCVRRKSRSTLLQRAPMSQADMEVAARASSANVVAAVFIQSIACASPGRGST